MNVTINNYETKCPGRTDSVTTRDNPGPPIDDKICIDPPPATGNWHISAVNGVIQGGWVQD